MPSHGSEKLPEPAAVSRWKKITLIGVALLMLFVTVAHDANQLREYNESASRYLRELMPDRVLAQLADEETACQFAWNWKLGFAACSSSNPGKVADCYVYHEPQFICAVQWVMKQPGVILRLIQDTLGWLVWPLAIAAGVAGVSLAPEHNVPAMIVTYFAALFIFYVGLLVGAFVLFVLSHILGDVLGFVAWVWSGIEFIVLATLFPREVYEKTRHVLALVRR
jgi:hypothetical protein